MRHFYRYVIAHKKTPFNNHAGTHTPQKPVFESQSTVNLSYFAASDFHNFVSEFIFMSLVIATRNLAKNTEI